MLKKLLILGSNGFLGRNLMQLINKEYFDKFYIHEIRNKDHIDLTNYEITNSFIKKISPNFIINCSSFVGGIAYGYKYPASILSKNIEMNNNIFKASLENQVELLINPISNCAYPGGLNEYREELFWEGKPHESVFNYALTRRLIVAMSEAYYSQFNLNSANIVLSNMYGPYDHFDIERSHALGALVNKIYTAKINNENMIEIWGTGNPIREWLYVNDGAKALMESLNLGTGSHLLNVGINKGISIKNLAEKIAENFNWNGHFEFNPNKPDGAIEKRVVGEKFYNLLNWKPQTSLDEGLKYTIEWYVENI